MSTKVAIVTGANKGIGLEIVRGLCKNYNGVVFLTARNKDRGKAAVKQLESEGLHPKFFYLDVTNPLYIAQLRKHIERRYGGIDLLINNAAIYFNKESTVPLAEQAEKTIQTNYTAVVNVCKILCPILRENAQVINMSSSAGHSSRIPEGYVRDIVRKKEISLNELDMLMMAYVHAVKHNKHIVEGFGDSIYVVSKVAVSTLTIIQQRILDAEKPNRNIKVNCCHPGYVKTDMTSGKGVLEPADGARSALYLALEDHNLRGKYIWFDTTEVDWYADTVPQNTK